MKWNVELKKHDYLTYRELSYKCYNQSPGPLQARPINIFITPQHDRQALTKIECYFFLLRLSHNTRTVNGGEENDIGGTGSGFFLPARDINLDAQEGARATCLRLIRLLWGCLGGRS